MNRPAEVKLDGRGSRILLVLRPKRSASFVTENSAGVSGGETPVDGATRTICESVPGAGATAEFGERRDAIATEALA